ncbi:DUF262 domain-containing HNH endonuclease family protein [Flavobacteriales bacterium]|nr:DUF262 domain-containing HNH endonuclease family protein [Flavobacteriales bacterium]
MAASASVVPIQAVLSKGMFDIPMYQRPYSWGKDEIETFCEDLLTLEDQEQHLLGMIVLSPTNKQVGGSDIFHIIDGQQRLTTCLLSLSICHDRVYDLSLLDSVQSNSDLKGQIQAILSELNTLLYDRRSKRPKLITHNENEIERKALLCLLSPPSSLDKNDFKQAATEIERFDTLEPAERNTSNLKNAILKNQGWHKGKLKAKKAIKNRDLIESILEKRLEGMDVEQKINFIDNFSTKIQRNLQCVQFEVDTEYNAFKLFETMNDRGLGISAMDLIKNLGLKYVHRSNRNDEGSDQEFFLSKWKQIFDENLSSGHLLFLRYANNARRPFKKTSEIYQVYRDDVFTSVDAVKGEMSALEGLSELFRDCWQTDHRKADDPFKIELGLLQSTKTQQWLVIAIALLHLQKQVGNEYDEKIRTILRLVYRLIFTQLVKELGANQFERPFPSWALLIYKSISDRGGIDSALNDVISKCKEKLREFELSPSDLAKKRFEKNDVAKTACYALHLMEGPKHGHDISLSLQLEHIYPQAPASDSWTSFDSLSEDTKKEYTYSLGNFILLDQSLNPSVGNSDFKEKQKAYAIHKVVDQLYPDGGDDAITELNEFGPETVATRTEDMANSLIQNLEKFCRS